MRKWLSDFMYGRYGADELSKALLGVCLVLIVINMFSGQSWAFTIELVLLIYCYFRMFSRNYAARSAENEKFLGMTSGLRRKIAGIRRNISQGREYHIYKCPSCRQKIRIPRGKGKIIVTCPKCRHEFTKKS